MMNFKDYTPKDSLCKDQKLFLYVNPCECDVLMVSASQHLFCDNSQEIQLGKCFTLGFKPEPGHKRGSDGRLQFYATSVLALHPLTPMLDCSREKHSHTLVLESHFVPWRSC